MRYEVIRFKKGYIILVSYPAGGFAGYVKDRTNLSVLVRQKSEADLFDFDYEAEAAISGGTASAAP